MICSTATSATRHANMSPARWFATCFFTLFVAGCSPEGTTTLSSSTQQHAVESSAQPPRQIVEQQLPEHWQVVATHETQTTSQNRPATAIVVEYRDSQVALDEQPQRVQYLIQDGKVVGFHRVNSQSTLLLDKD